MFEMTSQAPKTYCTIKAYEPDDPIQQHLISQNKFHFSVKIFPTNISPSKKFKTQFKAQESAIFQ